MGREVRRVPLDFDWPMKETWKGFLNPFYEHYHSCASCDGTGLNEESKKIEDAWYDFAGTGQRWCDNITQDEVDALIEAGRLRDFTHKWTGKKSEKVEPAPTITAEMVNRWEASGGIVSGHDAINRGICVEARAKRLGVWGHCAECGGDGEIWDSEEFKQKAEEWQQEPPPEGDGWQMWETTSEGSAISPVFATPEELARWLADTGASTFGHMTASYDEWLRMIRSEWAPSAVVAGRKMDSGVAFVGRDRDGEV